MDPSPRSSSPLTADDASSTFSSSTRYCCFCIPRSSSLWHRVRSFNDRIGPESSSASLTRRWWRAGVGALMKAREWSEIVAGPKWKTFIRRFNRNSRHHGGGGGSGNGRRFGYDPLSYALNFEGGSGVVSPERDYPDFSTRFVAPPAFAKSSMDLGGSDDAPVLFVPPPPPPVAGAVH